MQNKAFTLIELLVVVLIIGILAAIAVPQYQVAVLKSRLSQGYIFSSEIRQAEKIYYLANGKYTLNLSDLDISLPSCTVDTEKTANYAAEYATDTRQSIYYSCANDTIVRLYIDNGNMSVYTFVNSSSDDTLLLECYINRSGGTCASDYTTGKKACLAIGGEELATYGETTYYKLNI